eukprot:6183999-Pleurochrysis_carterae.AAC.6
MASALRCPGPSCASPGIRSALSYCIRSRASLTLSRANTHTRRSHARQVDARTDQHARALSFARCALSFARCALSFAR